jgi:hypothetical protein
MRRLLYSLILACLAITSVSAGEGMVNVPSAHSVPDTADRLEAILGAKGMTVFAQRRSANPCPPPCCWSSATRKWAPR